MNRLSIIQFINPGWHKQIVDFLQEHPSFDRLLPIVALDEYPCGFNKNPHETETHAPLNIFETILWGIAHAGVDFKYGDRQYLQMLKYMREVPFFTEDMDFPFEVQEKKIKTYKSLINICLENDINPHELSLEEMPLIEYVEDIADSTIAQVYLLYGDVGDDNVIPHADEYFNKGIEMFYGVPKPNRAQIKAITDTWSNKKVGLMFITQYAHYSSYIKEEEIKNEKLLEEVKNIIVEEVLNIKNKHRQMRHAEEEAKRLAAEEEELKKMLMAEIEKAKSKNSTKQILNEEKEQSQQNEQNEQNEQKEEVKPEKKKRGPYKKKSDTNTDKPKSKPRASKKTTQDVNK